MEVQLTTQLIDQFFRLKEIISAIQHNEYVKIANRRYYEKMSEARKQKYREAHPNPKPRGRPRKQVEV